MRCGIFSDVHSNLEALETVIHAFKNERIDRYFFVGDAVGYGPNPHECIEIIKGLQGVCIAGNHDWATVEKLDMRYFNPMAKEAIRWTRLKTSREDMAFLDKLELTFIGDELILVHGTRQEPSFFHYLMDEIQAKEMFGIMEKDLAFVGHSHIPGVFIKKKSSIRYLTCGDIQLEPGCRYIVNVGSVGQPRDGNPMASYCVYDTEAGIVSIKRINYDIESTQKKILQVGLPVFLAARLEAGR
ncbi:MAG TPA: metallophosphoesterase family protein [Candidatus Omnitrophota bacterium]|nr:metallophosphoesterase family protein [Candidatus Omnitrophota bacterium]HPD85086.1 metallophosphoesterase family protein [Candidatus Omnitrophota bacterium]HRZ03944.1 metallophosphoesterase family protein [Candidatus Omnitrophota bacterium]